MKNIVLIFALVLGVQSLFAQQFDKTDLYFISFESRLSIDGNEETTALLMTDDEEPVEVTSFPIVDVQMIDKLNITTLKNPGLEGVKRVIKVEALYSELCVYNVANYILETTKGGFITLPILTNEDCGDTANKMVYLFPNQEYGANNQILTSQLTYHATSIIAASMEDSFIWNDDSYGTSGLLYEEL